MLGMKLVTYQTGPDGQKSCSACSIEQGLKIERELYLGIVLDRASERPVLMVSQEGGVEIEKVADETPEKIFKEFIHPGVGLAALPDAQAGVRARARGAAGRAGGAS